MLENLGKNIASKFVKCVPEKKKTKKYEYVLISLYYSSQRYIHVSPLLRDTAEPRYTCKEVGYYKTLL